MVARDAERAQMAASAGESGWRFISRPTQTADSTRRVQGESSGCPQRRDPALTPQVPDLAGLVPTRVCQMLTCEFGVQRKVRWEM